MNETVAVFCAKVKRLVDEIGVEDSKCVGYQRIPSQVGDLGRLCSGAPTEFFVVKFEY